MLNGQISDWRKINSGVPKGTLLGPLLFLIYINELPEGIILKCRIFANDTSLFSKVINTINSENNLNADSKSISNGLTNGKYNSILIQRNKQMRLFFLGKQIQFCIFQLYSITVLLNFCTKFLYHVEYTLHHFLHVFFNMIILF